VGGGTDMEHGRADPTPGPSPRGRGNRAGRVRPGARSGTIPAWAGEPATLWPGAGVNGDHPRVGGGTTSLRAQSPPRSGPSPRGRGNRAQFPPGQADFGTIPAWAGEPQSWLLRPPLRQDHPRVGGGTILLHEIEGPVGGPSPRGRGNHRRVIFILASQGTIPAWAGEPRYEYSGAARRGDHPRVGGGTEWLELPLHRGQGPSPRGRGNREQAKRATARAGTIPAWAGEPGRVWGRGGSRWDHPRVGGGTSSAACPRPAAWGPSPRGRGNHCVARNGSSTIGTIPAWAGEPNSSKSAGSILRDHPRVGGGTPYDLPPADVYVGPSPRGRGNQNLGQSKYRPCGTIPAWAGEPRQNNTGP